MVHRAIFSYLRKFAPLLLVLFLTVGVGVAANLTQRTQDNRQRACNWITTACGSGCDDNQSLYTCPGYSAGGDGGGGGGQGQVAAGEGCDNGVSVGGTACRNQGEPRQFKCQPGSRPGASIWQEEACSGNGTCQGSSCTTSAQTTGTGTTVTTPQQPTTCDNSGDTAYSCRGKTVGHDNGGCQCQITSGTVCGCIGYGLNLGNGQSCVADQNCQSGNCENGRCIAQTGNGIPCGQDSECVSGACVNFFCGTRANATPTATPITGNTNLPACPSTACDAIAAPSGSIACLSGGGISNCCPSGQSILSGNVCGTPVITTPPSTPRPNGSFCSTDSQCISGRCNESVERCEAQPTASPRLNNTACTTDSQCSSGYCSPTARTCQTRPTAPPSTPRPNGSFCSTDSQCISGRCNESVERCEAQPTASPRLNNTACTTDSQCSSGYCSPTARTCQTRPTANLTATPIPTPKAIDASCSINSECQSGYCNPNAETCQIRPTPTATLTTTTATANLECGGHNQISCSGAVRCDLGCSVRTEANRTYCTCEAGNTESRIKKPDGECSLYALTPSSGCESIFGYRDSTCSSGYRCGKENVDTVNEEEDPEEQETVVPETNQCNGVQLTSCRIAGFEECSKTGPNLWNYSCNSGRDRTTAASPTSTPTVAGDLDCGGNYQRVCQNSPFCNTGCSNMGGNYCRCVAETAIVRRPDGECSYYVEVAGGPEISDTCNSGNYYPDLSCYSRIRCGVRPPYVPTQTPTLLASGAACTANNQCLSAVCTFTSSGRVCSPLATTDEPEIVRPTFGRCNTIQFNLCRIQQKDCRVNPYPGRNSALGMECFGQVPWWADGNERSTCDSEMQDFCGQNNRGGCIVVEDASGFEEYCVNSDDQLSSADQIESCGGDQQQGCRTTQWACDDGCTYRGNQCSCRLNAYESEFNQCEFRDSQGIQTSLHLGAHYCDADRYVWSCSQSGRLNQQDCRENGCNPAGTACLGDSNRASTSPTAIPFSLVNCQNACNAQQTSATSRADCLRSCEAQQTASPRLNNAGCTNNAQCSSGYCNPVAETCQNAPTSTVKVTEQESTTAKQSAEKLADAICTRTSTTPSAQCQSGVAHRSTTCPTGYRCGLAPTSTALPIATPRANDTACTQNSECASDYCDSVAQTCQNKPEESCNVAQRNICGLTGKSCRVNPPGPNRNKNNTLGMECYFDLERAYEDPNAGRCSLAMQVYCSFGGRGGGCVRFIDNDGTNEQCAYQTPIIAAEDPFCGGHTQRKCDTASPECDPGCRPSGTTCSCSAGLPACSGTGECFDNYRTGATACEKVRVGTQYCCPTDQVYDYDIQSCAPRQALAPAESRICYLPTEFNPPRAFMEKQTSLCDSDRYLWSCGEDGRVNRRDCGTNSCSSNGNFCIDSTPQCGGQTQNACVQGTQRTCDRGCIVLGNGTCACGNYLATNDSDDPNTIERIESRQINDVCTSTNQCSEGLFCRGGRCSISSEYVNQSAALSYLPICNTALACKGFPLDARLANGATPCRLPKPTLAQEYDRGMCCPSGQSIVGNSCAPTANPVADIENIDACGQDLHCYVSPRRGSTGGADGACVRENTVQYCCPRGQKDVDGNGACQNDALTCSQAHIYACRFAGFDRCIKTGTNLWNYRCENALDSRTIDPVWTPIPTPSPTPIPTLTPEQIEQQRMCNYDRCACVRGDLYAPATTVRGVQCPSGYYAEPFEIACNVGDHIRCVGRGGCFGTSVGPRCADEMDEEFQRAQLGEATSPVTGECRFQATLMDTYHTVPLNSARCFDKPAVYYCSSSYGKGSARCDNPAELTNAFIASICAQTDCLPGNTTGVTAPIVGTCSSLTVRPAVCDNTLSSGYFECRNTSDDKIYRCCANGTLRVGDTCEMPAANRDFSCGGDGQAVCGGNTVCDLGCIPQQDNRCSCAGLNEMTADYATILVEDRYQVDIPDGEVNEEEINVFGRAIEDYAAWRERAYHFTQQDTLFGRVMANLTNQLADQSLERITCEGENAILTNCEIRTQIQQNADTLAQAEYLSRNYGYEIYIGPDVNMQDIQTQIDAIAYSLDLIPQAILEDNFNQLTFYSDPNSRTGGFTHQRSDVSINTGVGAGDCSFNSNEGIDCENAGFDYSAAKIFTHEVFHNVVDYMIPTENCEADTRIDDCAESAGEIMTAAFEEIGLYFDENGEVDTSRTNIFVYRNSAGENVLGDLGVLTAQNNPFQFHQVGSPANFDEFFTEVLSNTMFQPEMMQRDYPEMYAVATQILAAEYEQYTDAAGNIQVRRIGQ